MKSLIYIFFVLMLMVSCTSRTIYKKPDNLITKDKMIDIWTDLYIASAAKSVKTTSLRKDINYIPLVLEKHGIDSVQFSNSNRYYTSKIDMYEKMFIKVNERLKEMKNIYEPETELDSILKANKEKQDKHDGYE